MQTHNNSVLEISDMQQLELIHELSENNYRNQQLIQSIPVAVYTCDLDGYITFYNKAAVKLWGREPIIGEDLWCGSWKTFRPEDGSPLPLDDCPIARTLKNSKSVRGEEIIIECPDGTRRNVAPHPDPIFDSGGKLIGAVNMLIDITDLKKKEYALRESEEQLREVARELELRVNQRTKDLNEANAALKNTNNELEQFAFIASHDMQEPLRKIKSYAGRLNRSQLDEQGIKHLEKVMSSAERMSSLINDLLNYSQMGSSSDQFVKTDLDAVLQEELNELEVLINQKQATIDKQKLPAVKAIPYQMIQLFRNLLANSLKFLQDHVPGKITIASKILTLDEIIRLNIDKDQQYTEIVITDNGIGFSQEYAENIFQIFRRLNGRSSKYEGTGIGLAVCKKIMDLHSGKIFAISQENIGTSIHIILPIGYDTIR